MQNIEHGIEYFRSGVEYVTSDTYFRISPDFPEVQMIVVGTYHAVPLLLMKTFT